MTIEAHVDDGDLRLAVRDTGVGMRDGDAIFEHGVGLRNVRDRLLRLYGADYAPQVISRPGDGTTVTLRIPVAAGQRVTRGAEQRRARRRARRSCAALVVDDEKLARERLCAASCATSTTSRSIGQATNGVEAVHADRGAAARPGVPRHPDAGHGRLRRAARR